MNEAEDLELYQKATENLLKIFVIPEIELRQSRGSIPKPFALQAAQIIFYPDGRKPLVRLNDEVKAILKVQLKPGVEKALEDIIYANEIDDIAGINLGEGEDPDCGHATIVNIKGSWGLAFDFIYNKGTAKKHLEAGKEFLKVAKHALSEKLRSAFIDTLYSAAELSAKALLLGFMSDPKFKTNATHKAIHSRYNRFAHLGNVDMIYTQAFNKLAELRTPARYLEREFSLSEADYQNLNSTVNEMIDDVEKALRI